MYFPQFSPTSKVWVYTADRALSAQEQDVVNAALTDFMKEWAAHGNQLFGDAAIINDRFIVLAVDEAQASASGCSIDTSVRFIKEIGTKLRVDFFNRMNLVVEKDNAFQYVHISELGNQSDGFVYNPMVTTLQELRENWRMPISESPFV